MPPKVSGDSQDFKFMWSCIMNADTKPKINWEAVAKDMELKNGACASARFGQILKKHNYPNKWSSNPNNAGDTPASASVKRKRAETCKTTSKRPKKTAANANADADGDDDEPAVKTQKVNAKGNTDIDDGFLAKLNAHATNVSVKEESPDDITGFTGKTTEAEDIEDAETNAVVDKWMQNGNNKNHQKALMYEEMQREDHEAEDGEIGH